MLLNIFLKSKTMNQNQVLPKIICLRTALDVKNEITVLLVQTYHVISEQLYYILMDEESEDVSFDLEYHQSESIDGFVTVVANV